MDDKSKNRSLRWLYSYPPLMAHKKTNNPKKQSPIISSVKYSSITKRLNTTEKMIVAAASYDGGVFPCMQDFLYHLQSKAYQNRKVGILENGSWAPSAARTMKAILETMKNLEIVEPVVTIRSTLKESDLPELNKLADLFV